jgi:hypothetical protein
MVIGARQSIDQRRQPLRCHDGRRIGACVADRDELEP